MIADRVLAGEELGPLMDDLLGESQCQSQRRRDWCVDGRSDSP